MSYSLNDKCGGCKLFEECTDHELIRGAIDTIHHIGYDKSHRGSGTITIDCQNFVAQPTPEDIAEIVPEETSSCSEDENVG
jgi:hypothetical protein